MQPSRENYGPLSSRQTFYDVNGIYAPIATKRASLLLGGRCCAGRYGLGGLQLRRALTLHRVKLDLNADPDGDRFAVFLRGRKEPFLHRFHCAFVQVLVEPLYHAGILRQSLGADYQPDDDGANGPHAAVRWIMRIHLLDDARRSDAGAKIVDRLVVGLRAR